jgi:hypothetical protein
VVTLPVSRGRVVRGWCWTLPTSVRYLPHIDDR